MWPDEPVPDTTQPAKPTKKINAAVLLILAAVFITIPICLFALLFMWLSQSSFQSIEELNADELAEIRIELKNLPRGPQNRPDPTTEEKLRPDENTPFHTDPDIDPTQLTRPDFEVFLNTLRNAERVQQKPPSPYLGKVEVRYKDGRRGTILLYWSEDSQTPNAPAIVWMRIGTGFRGADYKACTLKELRTVAQACAERGEKVRR
jgi:hypothetical protein